jgi:hypothetical protein
MDVAPSSSRRAGQSARKADKYTEAANLENQPCVFDLVPIRYRWLSFWAASGVACIAAVLAGHFYLPGIIAERLPARAGAFDLAASGNLAAWFSSIMLLWAAATAILVYSLRRHRVDDYKGRYRVWLWAAAALLAMSIDESASLRLLVQDVATHVAKSPLYGDGSLWWISGWGLVITVLGARLLFDVRECRSALCTLLLSAALWAGAACAHLGLIQLPAGETLLVAAGCRMGAYSAVLLGLTLQARYLVLDVQGLVPVRQRKVKLKKAKASDSADDGPAVVKMDSARKTTKVNDKRTDLDPVGAIKFAEKASAGPAKSQPPSTSANKAAEEFDEEELLESSGGHRKMSRADRKRLRKEQQEHRKAG